MPTIRLNNAQWTYDEAAPLGRPGGFGEVFRGLGEAGPVAVKRLKITAGAAAHREMNIGSWLAERELPHVVPVLDYGQDANSDSYFLVMPVCEQSLQDEINSKGPLLAEEVRAIALDVLAGLREAGAIVHRDLKPGNILLLNGVWRLADFGIAKFVEDSTSLQTLRGSLTVPYGAPEQWLGERPTPATDIYALGCIIYAMVTGRPPFVGSDDDVREAHLHGQPGRLGGDPRLAGLVSHMLRKAPASRPDASRCASIISTAGQVAQPVHGLLAVAGRAIAEQEAAAEAAARAAQTQQRERAALIAEAVADLKRIRTALFAGIRDQAVSAVAGGEDLLTLGRAMLHFTINTSEEPQAKRLVGNMPASNGWEIIASARIAIIQKHSHGSRDDIGGRVFRFAADPEGYSWSASLLYGRVSADEGFRWYEAAFWSMSVRSKSPDEPTSIAVGDALEALGPTIGVHQVAYGPIPIDAEDEPSFERRWQGLVGKAAVGELQRPSTLPIDPSILRQMTEE